jgi:hypothetical protein
MYIFKSRVCVFSTTLQILSGHKLYMTGTGYLGLTAGIGSLKLLSKD